MLQTKHQGSRPCRFLQEDFFMILWCSFTSFGFEVITSKKDSANSVNILQQFKDLESKETMLQLRGLYDKFMDFCCYFVIY